MLPSQVTTFVGRERELRELKGLLKRSRLITLTGPGGVGKTRIALRVAADLEAGFTDGVCYVELSELQDPELLAHTVAAALHLPEQASRSELDVLVDYLESRRVLVLLDTCEHLVDACAMLADVLMRGTRHVRVLATSRQPLDVPGEHLISVPPLDELEEAITLFADRAAAVAPWFGLDAGTTPLAGELCRRLDGIPLAIELAAVRLRALSMEQLVDRLDDRFRLLSGGSRTSLSRHQTLRTAIGWSHELCPPGERLLWARLSVFAGDFDLAAVERICGGGDLAEDDLMDHLIGLVDKSIVLRADVAGAPRYRLLDTLREYGREWLAGLDEVDRYRARHRDHYLSTAMRFEAEWEGLEQLEWLRRIQQDRGNLRLALEYCLSTPGEEADGLTMATALWASWLALGRLGEGRHWFDKALTAVREPCSRRAHALWMDAVLTGIQGENRRAVGLFEEGRVVAQQAGDDRALAWATSYLGTNLMFLGDLPEARGCLAEAATLFGDLDDPVGLAVNRYCGAMLAAITGDVQGALDLCEESLGLLSDGDLYHQAYAHFGRAVALLVAGRHTDCQEAAAACARMKHELGDVAGTGQGMELLACVAAATGEPERAAWIFGAADVLWERVGFPRFGMRFMDGFHDVAVEQATKTLGQDRYDEAYQAGFRLPTDEAVARAVGEPLPSWGDLTREERQIAVYLAEGMGGKEIAERMIISRRSADARIEHVLNVLGFSSRAQIEAVAAEIRTRRP